MNGQLRALDKKPESKKENLVSQIEKTILSRSSHLRIDQLFHLHDTIGNQALQRLFQSGAIQPKLSIGKPNDIY